MSVELLEVTYRLPREHHYVHEGERRTIKLGGRGVHRALLHLLAWRTNGEGHAWPSVAKMAANVGSYPSTVRDAIRELEDAGLLVREQRQHERGGQKSNRYVLNEALLRALADEANEDRAPAEPVGDRAPVEPVGGADRAPVDPVGGAPVEPVGRAPVDPVGPPPVEPVPIDNPNDTRNDTRNDNRVHRSDARLVTDWMERAHIRATRGEMVGAARALEAYGYARDEDAVVEVVVAIREDMDLCSSSLRDAVQAVTKMSPRDYAMAAGDRDALPIPVEATEAVARSSAELDAGHAERVAS